MNATVTVALLPDASVTVTSRLWSPTPIRVPAAGICDFTNSPAAVQESEAMTSPRMLGTCAWQLAPAVIENGEGTLRIFGGVVSATVNSTVQVELLPDRSVTVNVTGCCPRPT